MPVRRIGARNSRDVRNHYLGSFIGSNPITGAFKELLPYGVMVAQEALTLLV